MNKRPSPPQNTALPLDASTLDGLPDPVFLVGQSMIIVDYNRAARLHLGETVLGAKLDKSLDSADVIQAISDSLAGTPGTRSDIFLPYPIPRNFGPA